MAKCIEHSAKRKGQNRIAHGAKRIALIVFFLSLCPMPYALCSDIQFEATVSRKTVSLGESLQLNLSFYGIQNISAPQISNIDGFNARYLGPSTRMSIVNGKVSASVTHIYKLLPLKTGVFEIGPFSVKYKSEAVTSNSVTVEVVSSGAAPPASGGNTQPQGLGGKEISDRIFLIMEPAKIEVYLNESIPLIIKLYINRLAVRDIQYPKFKHEGFSVAEFDKPKQYREALDGVLYDVIEFNTRIFAVKTGNITLGPAAINCNLVINKKRPRKKSSPFSDFFGGAFDSDIFNDFFGRYELYPFNAVSPGIPVNVLPIPEEGKPSDFKGAVGDFHMEAEISPKKVKAGDPITLTMTIQGKGNFDTVMPPEIESRKGFKVYEPQEKQDNKVKVFEQILMPQSENVKNIPEVSFSFFNPSDGEYHTIKRGPFAITVEASTKREAKIIGMPQGITETAGKEYLGKDIVYIKEYPGRLRKKGDYIYRKLSYWVFQFTALIIFVSLLTAYIYKERLKNDVKYARRLAAPRKARAGIKEAQRLLGDKSGLKFFDAVFNTMRAYLGDKLHLSTGNVTKDEIDKILKSKNINEDTRKKIKIIFDDCDAARFAPSEFDIKRMESIFEDMREVIDYMERKRL